MRGLIRRYRGKFFLGGFFTLIGLSLLLQGCFRHGNWNHNPEQMESRFNEKSADIAEDLEIKPGAQQQAFDALAAHLKTVMIRMGSIHRQTGLAIKQVVNEETMDADAVALALKQAVPQRPSEAEWNTAIDLGLALYHTMDAEQQERVRKELHRHVRRFDDQ